MQDGPWQQRDGASTQPSSVGSWPPVAGASVPGERETAIDSSLLWKTPAAVTVNGTHQSVLQLYNDNNEKDERMAGDTTASNQL